MGYVMYGGAVFAVCLGKYTPRAVNDSLQCPIPYPASLH